LKSLQIDDSQVIDGLLNAHQKSPNACWEVKLRLGEKGSFDYTVKPEMASGSVFLNVC